MPPTRAVTLAEGYVRNPGAPWDTAETMGWLAAPGVTGIHVVRPDLLGFPAPPGPVVDANGTHTEFPNPATTPDEAHLLSPHDDLHVWL